MDLFATNGYDETTVAQVAEAAGMSERSFFRYFSSKADIAFASQDKFGHTIEAALAGRPATEPLWYAVRRAFDSIIDTIDRNPEGRSLRLSTLFYSTPELHRVRLQRLDEWATLLAPHVAVHLDEPSNPDVPDPRPAAIAASAVMCYEAALATWVSVEGKASMAALFDETMDAIAHVGRLEAGHDTLASTSEPSGASPRAIRRT